MHTQQLAIQGEKGENAASASGGPRRPCSGEAIGEKRRENSREDVGKWRLRLYFRFLFGSVRSSSIQADMTLHIGWPRLKKRKKRRAPVITSDTCQSSLSVPACAMVLCHMAGSGVNEPLTAFHAQSGPFVPFFRGYISMLQVPIMMQLTPLVFGALEQT